MDRRQVSDWLLGYIAAWRSYDADRIGDLFSDDAEYRFRPHEDPIRGRAAIVDAWLDDRDEPGTYDAAYEPVAVDGDVAVATGASTYFAADGSVERVFDNCFLLRFDADGRCRGFTEWFMERHSG